MKQKRTLLLTLLTLCTIGAWADVTISSLYQFSNYKAYYVTTKARGAWYVPEGGTQLTSTTKAGVSASSSDEAQQFAFLTYGMTGTYYLYSISEKKFVSKSGDYTTLTASLGNNVTLESTADTDYPVVVALQGSYHMAVSNGYTPAVITRYNSLTDEGNKVKIQEVGDFDPTEAMAVLKTYYDDNSYHLDTKSYYINASNSSRGSLGTYTPASSSTTYLASTVSGTDNPTTKPTVSKKKFAFIYYESNFYLYSVDDGKFVTFLNTTKAPLKDVYDSTDDAITFHHTSGSYFQLRFGGNSSRIINSTDYNNEYGVSISNWGDVAGHLDAGNQYYIEEAGDFDQSPVITALDDFFYGEPAFNAAIATLESCSGNLGSEYGQYSFESPYDTYTASDIASLKSEGFSAENLATAQAIVAALTLNTPPAGFYRLKNVATNQYLYAKTGPYTYSDTTTGVFADGEATDGATVIELRSIDDKLHIFNQGYNFGWVIADPSTGEGAGVGYLTTDESKYVNWFPGTSPGQLAFAICYGNGTGAFASYLERGIYTVDTSNNTVIGGDDYTADAAQWIVEDATSVTIPLNNVGGKSYGTMYLPYDITLPSGTAVPELVSVRDGNAYLSEIEETLSIPAGKPVLLYSATGAASVTASITTGAEAIGDETALVGTYFEKASLGDNEYIFSTRGGELGFWKMASGKKVGMNKAYLYAEGGSSDVKGFSLSDDDPTGLAALHGDATRTDIIHDLQGRRVKHPAKGIYIQNGKKVMVK